MIYLLGGGAQLDLGLGTAVARLALGPCWSCTAYVGLMRGGPSGHRGEGFSVFRGGYEYAVLVGIVAIAPDWFGPGAWPIGSCSA